MGEPHQAGLDNTDYAAYAPEQKLVTMFSGCRDDQTSADAYINGMSEGAMSWAFLEIMRQVPNPSYLQVRGLGPYLKILLWKLTELRLYNILELL
jgi:hypothetical protein